MKEVVEEVTDSVMQISLAQAKMKDINAELEDFISVELLLRILVESLLKAKQVVVQKIREEEERFLSAV